MSYWSEEGGGEKMRTQERWDQKQFLCWGGLTDKRHETKCVHLTCKGCSGTEINKNSWLCSNIIEYQYNNPSVKLYFAPENIKLLVCADFTVFLHLHNWNMSSDRIQPCVFSEKWACLTRQCRKATWTHRQCLLEEESKKSYGSSCLISPLSTSLLYSCFIVRYISFHNAVFSFSFALLILLLISPPFPSAFMSASNFNRVKRGNRVCLNKSHRVWKEQWVTNCIDA